METKIIGHIRCPDENIDSLGERDTYARADGVLQLDFGIVGSGVIKMGGGEQARLPDSTRRLFLENQSAVLEGLNMAIQMCGGIAEVTSHAGCGWVGLQGVKDVTGATVSMCDINGLPYAGHIRYAEYPEQVGSSLVWANIGRPEHVHHHGATSITVTMDGGIEGSELANFESSGYGDGFVVSAEGFCLAVAAGNMSEQSAIAMLSTELQILDGLAERRIIGAGAVRPFYSGRMPSDYAQYSRYLFDQAVATLVPQS